MRQAVQQARHWPAVLLVLVVLLIQGSLQAFFFPLESVLDDKRLLHIDAPYHEYQIEIARVLCEQRRVTGYDPHFAAGQIGGVNLNASAKVPALVGCLAAGTSLSSAAAYKLFSFTAGVVAPAFLVLACVLLRVGVATSALVGVLAILLWWTGPLRWYHTAGMTAYVLSAFVGVTLAVAVTKAFAGAGLGRLLAVAAAAALTMFLHPLSLLGVALISLPGIALQLRGRAAWARAIGSVFVIVAAVWAVNGFWIQEVLGASGYAFSAQPYQRVVDPGLAVKELLQIAPTASQGSHLYLALLVGTVMFLAWSQAPYRRAMVGLVLGGALLMAWAMLSAAWEPLASLQPNRFSAMAWLCLALPSVEGVRCAWQKLVDRAAAPLWRAASLLGLLAWLLVTGFYVRETMREIFVDHVSKYGVQRPEVQGTKPLSKQLGQYLRQQTTSEARVFFELSLGRRHDGGHMAALYALDAQREFIGGPYPYVDFANTWDGVAFGKEFRSYRSRELAKIFDAYNIGWMICHSQSCKAAMSRLEGASLEAEFGDILIFKRVKVPGYVLEGAGRVTGRCVNRLEVRADAGTTTMVLRYHWVPGLRSFPEAELVPEPGVPGDRPWVRINNPPPEFVLGMGSRLPPECKQRLGRPESAIATR